MTLESTEVRSELAVGARGRCEGVLVKDSLCQGLGERQDLPDD